MKTLNTVQETIAFLEAYLGPCRPAPGPMTDEEIRAVEEAFAAAPPLADWVDADVDDFFDDRDEFGEGFDEPADCDSPEGF